LHILIGFCCLHVVEAIISNKVTKVCFLGFIHEQKTVAYNCIAS